MSESQSLGEKGESLAADFLLKKGYRIRNRNWKSGRKEIDIIAENDDFIVIVEVKTRNRNFQVHPRDAVTREKQRSLIYAADWYLKHNNLEKECRFDIITIIENEGTFEVDHIENAFYPTLK